MVDHTTKNSVAGDTSGNTTWRNVAQRPAPSSRAASTRLSGTPCSAARYTITSNPSQPQTVIATIEYSAWSGFWKNPYVPRCTLPSM